MRGLEGKRRRGMLHADSPGMHQENSRLSFRNTSRRNQWHDTREGIKLLPNTRRGWSERREGRKTTIAAKHAPFVSILIVQRALEDRVGWGRFEDCCDSLKHSWRATSGNMMANVFHQNWAWLCGKCHPINATRFITLLTAQHCPILSPNYFNCVMNRKY